MPRRGDWWITVGSVGGTGHGARHGNSGSSRAATRHHRRWIAVGDQAAHSPTAGNLEARGEEQPTGEQPQPDRAVATRGRLMSGAWPQPGRAATQVPAKTPQSREAPGRGRPIRRTAIAGPSRGNTRGIASRLTSGARPRLRQGASARPRHRHPANSRTKPRQPGEAARGTASRLDSGAWLQPGRAAAGSPPRPSQPRGRPAESRARTASSRHRTPAEAQHVANKTRQSCAPQPSTRREAPPPRPVPLTRCPAAPN